MNTPDEPRPLHDCVQILDVVLRESTAWTSMNPGALPDHPPRLVLDHAVQAARHGDVIVAEVRLSVVGTAAEDDSEQVLKLTALYAAVYACDPTRTTTDEELASFGNLSAIFNVWPFWRELASSYYGRMKLPLPILPSLSPNIGLVLGREPSTDEE